MPNSVLTISTSLLKSLLHIIAASASINKVSMETPVDEPVHPALHSLAVNVLSGLVNIPVDYLPALKQQGDLNAIFTSFIEVLQTQIVCADESYEVLPELDLFFFFLSLKFLPPSSGIKGAIPTIMMMSMCAKAIPECRMMIIKNIFPNRDIENEEIPVNNVR